MIGQSAKIRKDRNPLRHDSPHPKKKQIPTQLWIEKMEKVRKERVC